MQTLKLNIDIIDDHALITQMLSFLLEQFEFVDKVQTFKNGKEYLQQEGDAEADIIITDIIMPEMSGIELLTELEKRKKKAKIIILSAVVEIQTIRHAMRSGASGYLGKNTTAEEFKNAILTVYYGEPYVGESLRKKLIRNTLIEDKFLYNLSPREKEVLNYVCKGKTIKETAATMQLSANTVQTYYKSILKKFNLNRTADLIVFAIQNGLVNSKTDNENRYT
jgi:DNA-binding NarL/FixJ family response regulator